MAPSDVFDLILGGVAGYILMQVLPALRQMFVEYRWRSRLPLLVVTRCEVSAGDSPAVQIEGRVTTLKGKYFPRFAESANATVHASADGFVVTSAGRSLPNARIDAGEVRTLEHDAATAQSVYISGVTLSSIAVYLFSIDVLTAAMLAALLIAMGIGGFVFELHRSYLFIVKGDEEKAIVLRMTATDKRVPLDRGFDALFGVGCAALDKRYPDVRPGTAARSHMPRRKS